MIGSSVKLSRKKTRRCHLFSIRQSLSFSKRPAIFSPKQQFCKACPPKTWQQRSHKRSRGSISIPTPQHSSRFKHWRHTFLNRFYFLSLVDKLCFSNEIKWKLKSRWWKQFPHWQGEWRSAEGIIFLSLLLFSITQFQEFFTFPTKFKRENRRGKSDYKALDHACLQPQSPNPGCDLSMTQGRSEIPLG